MLKIKVWINNTSFIGTEFRNWRPSWRKRDRCAPSRSFCILNPYITEKDRLQFSGSCSTNDPHLQVQLIVQGFRFGSVVPLPQNLPFFISGMLPVENSSLCSTCSAAVPGTVWSPPRDEVHVCFSSRPNSSPSASAGRSQKKTPHTQQMRDEQQQRNATFWSINSFHHFCLPHIAPPGQQPDPEHSLWPPVMDPAEEDHYSGKNKNKKQ